MSTQIETHKLTKAEAARQNGAKSRGPTTPEGKQKSARNATKSGAYANHALILANEDPDAFREILVAYITRFAPTDPFEHNLIRELAATDWQISRQRANETALINAELLAQTPPEGHLNDPAIESTLTAAATDALFNRSRTLAHIQRQIHQLTITRQRLLDTLLDARRNFPIQRQAPDLDLPEPRPAAPIPFPKPSFPERTQPDPATPPLTPPENPVPALEEAS